MEQWSREGRDARTAYGLGCGEGDGGGRDGICLWVGEEGGEGIGEEGGEVVRTITGHDVSCHQF